MERKEFIQTTAAALSSLFVVNWGTRAAIRELKDPQKPLLTANNLNRGFSRTKNIANYQRTMGSVISNPRSYVEQNYSLTEAQKTRVAQLTDEDWNKVTDVMKLANEKNNSLMFSFINRGQGIQGGCQIQIKVIDPQGGILKTIAV